jgi:hypothetical protein
MNNSLALTFAVPLSQEQTWRAIVDWQGQSKWMFQTKVWVEGERTSGVGVKIAAFTGPLYRYYPRFKKLGLLDLMEVTAWNPPVRCDVIHHGLILKGSGVFEVEAIDDSHSLFHWSEEIEAPRALFLLIRPFILIGVKISLARFVRQQE